MSALRIGMCTGSRSEEGRRVRYIDSRMVETDITDLAYELVSQHFELGRCSSRYWHFLGVEPCGRVCHHDRSSRSRHHKVCGSYRRSIVGSIWIQHSQTRPHHTLTRRRARGSTCQDFVVPSLRDNICIIYLRNYFSTLIRLERWPSG